MILRQGDIDYPTLLNKPPHTKINTDYFHDKIVLVIGGCGSIGVQVVERLIELRAKMLIIIDNSEFNIAHLYHKYRSIVFGLVDICDKNHVEYYFSKYRPDIVFHCAAYKHVPILEDQPYSSIRVNILGTQIVANLSILYNTKKFIYLSTDKAVNPTSIMGYCKRISEIYIQSMNQLERTEFIITRFGNVVGSSGSIIPIFIDRINNGLSLEVTHEKIIRYLMTIPEAVDLMIYCCEHGTRSDIFCFDMGEPINILELTKKFIELYAPGTQIDIIGLRKGEKMYEELYYSHETKEKTGHEKIFRLKPDSFVFEDFIREYENFLNKDFLQMNPIEIKKYMSDIINVASV